jgi:hypothetical protein
MMEMRNAQQVLDQYVLEMRWRCLSLAADLDRVDRAPGAQHLIASDPRLAQLREAFKVLLANEPQRAARVQMIFSDMSPPPSK